MIMHSWMVPISRQVVLFGAVLAIAGCGSKSGSSGTTTTTTKTTPTITWATPASIVAGTALSATQLNATASVTGTFAYTPPAGTVESTPGSVTLSVTFTPTDTTNYNTATASVTLTVTATNRATPTVTWATPASITYGTALSATQLDATASVAGSFSYTPAAGKVLSVGSNTLSVTFTPTDSVNYNTVTATTTLTVTQATPTIVWPAPSPIAVGTALSSTQLDATALVNGTSVGGTFVYSPVAGTIESTAETVLLAVTFTPTDTTDYTTASGTTSLIVAAADTAVVDFGTTEQTIRGFGVSEAWYGVMSNSQITSLYGTDSADLGLSIMRLQIQPTTWTSSTQTADTSTWTTQVTNGLAAQKLGATIFASPWTPPASMKTNNSQNEGSLSTSSYADYAAYLKSFVNYATNKGLNIYSVSLQNEPDWNPCDPSGTDEGPTGKDCYDSCLWSAAQFDTWIASYGSVLTSGTNPVKLMMPESYYFSSAMSDKALNDSAAEPYISIIGGHLYGSKPTYYANAKNKDKDVWETEHYLGPLGSDTTKTTIADGLAAAEELHNSMTVAQYNAYVWWWALQSKSTDTENYLLDASGNPTYYGYALGQFSRFVRPGYVRVNATETPVTGVYLSAYSGSDSTGTSHYVIVAINSTTSAVSLPVSVENQTLTSLTPYQTTASGGLAAQSAVTVSNGGFTANLPAQSIITFVQ